MSPHNPLRVRDEIVSEAAVWFVELNENPQSASTRKDFDEWLRRSPEHLQAYLQVSAHWEENRPGPGVRVGSIEELVALARTEANVVRVQTRRDRAGRTAGIDSAANRKWPIALAASLLAVAVGVPLWWHFLHGVYSTGVGEQSTVTLDDGSVVELNTRTRLRIRYTAHRRHIELLAGEALFDVAPDKSRPFTVQSQGAQVLAVGTQFDVYRKKIGTVVTVVEGRVEVTPVQSSVGERSAELQSGEPGSALHRAPRANGRPIPGSSPQSSEDDNPEMLLALSPQGGVLVSAGDQVTVSSHTAEAAATLHPQPANIEAAIAWTQHRLIFKHARLSEVVAEFNRYNRRPLVITDPTIADTRVSGSFSSSDPTLLLDFLRKIGPYTVTQTPSVIEISRH